MAGQRTAEAAVRMRFYFETRRQEKKKNMIDKQQLGRRITQGWNAETQVSVNDASLKQRLHLRQDVTLACLSTTFHHTELVTQTHACTHAHIVVLVDLKTI